MYVQFFRLNEAPFSITPDPAFLYLSPRHHEALAHLLYGTGESGGFVALTGEVGTGKTTVLRTLLQQQLPQVDAALILNPRQSEKEFVQSICDELAVRYPSRASLKQLIDALNGYLLDAHARGRRTVLIIDEAQNLSETLLEQVRLLTNLETHKQKLLRIILVGQPELNELLARPSMRQLAQRITARFHLTALDADETAEYVAHRLRVAGGDAELFPRRALRIVYRASGGIPRLINVICDRALLAAYSSGTRQITPGVVREAARAATSAPHSASHWPRWLWIPGVAVTAALAAVLVWLLRDPAPPPAPSAAPPAAAESAAPVDSFADGNGLLRLAESLQPRPTPAAHTPGEAPEPPESPDELLARLPPLGEQIEVLLGLWDPALEIASDAPVCDAIAVQRLRCLRLRGDWQQVEYINRPAILSLVSSAGETRHALVTGLDDTRARLLLGRNFVTVERDIMDLLWNGELFVVWRSSFDEPTVIRPGDRDNAVQWLRSALAAEAGEPLPEPVDDHFDEALRRDVEAFQRRNGLDVDGHVGEQTKVVLMQAVSDGPTLRNGGLAAAPPGGGN